MKNFFRKMFCFYENSKTVNESLVSDFKDFEDAMQYYSAEEGGAHCIITRNKDDFAASKLAVYDPKEFLDMLKNKSKI